MNSEQLIALTALCEAQRGLEAAEERRTQLVKAARAAGSTWEQISYAVRMNNSVAWRRWADGAPPRRRGLPVPVTVLREKRRKSPAPIVEVAS